MKLNYKAMVKALGMIEDERQIPADVIRDAICEAIAKAFKKDAELQDIDVYCEINEKTKNIDLYQSYVVVENVEDDELEISLEDAKKIRSDAELGDRVSREVEITDMSRAAAQLAKNVVRQKIREAEKSAVYNEYIDQVNDMVLGVVESVKDKFALINLGKTVAIMTKDKNQIPGERLIEGQTIRVVITEVNKETKGSQVVVSRADPMLVKRLFEKEVPEIFNGTVEIKAIARKAGERTKMAVLSHNPDVDPIGACIGPRGQRVQEIIEEIHGEKIDIFQWSDDITELVKNALAPAEIKAVLPGEKDRDLIVVVAEDQLSLAIGKRGKNASLAVKLTGHKIDIKTRNELEEAGYDYNELLEKASRKKEEYAEEAKRKESERAKEAALAEEEKRLAAVAELRAKNADMYEEAEEDGFIPEEMQEVVSEKVVTDMVMADEPKEDEMEVEEPEEELEVENTEEVEEPVEETTDAQNEEPEETVEEIKEPAKKKHADLEEMAEKNTYVSRFEKLTDTSKPKQDSKYKKKFKKKKEEENYKVDNKELEKQLKEKFANASQPIYTEEELAEIEAQQEAEAEREYSDDFDEYEDYYDEEN